MYVYCVYTMCRYVCIAYIIWIHVYWDVYIPTYTKLHIFYTHTHTYMYYLDSIHIESAKLLKYHCIRNCYSCKGKIKKHTHIENFF